MCFHKNGISFLLLILVLLLNYDVALSQINPSENLSKLNEELIFAEGSDRIKILHQLAMLERFSNPNEALINAETSLRESKDQNNDSLIAESNYRIGLIRQLKGDYVIAINNLIDAQILHKKYGYIFREMVVMNSLGTIYTDIGQYEKAIDIFFTTLNYYIEIEKTQDEIFSLTYIGRNHQLLGNYQSSKKYFEDAVQKSITHDHWINGIIALTELGTLESQYGNVESAVESFQKAIDWLNEKGSMHAIPTLMLNIAITYRDADELGEALRLTEESIAFSDSLGMEVFVVNGVRDLALIYQLMGDYQKSISTINEFLTTTEDSRIMESTRFDILEILSDSYFHTNQFEKAIEVSKEASQLTIEKKSWIRADSLLSNLIKSEIKLGRFEDAVYHQNLQMQVKDSIRADEQELNISKFDAQYEVIRKEQEIALLEVEREQRKLVQIGIVIGAVFILLIAFLVIRNQYFRIQRRDVRLENEELRRKELEKDLDFKNKQLVTQSLNILQKKELILDMKEKVEKFKEEGSARELRKLSNQIDYSFTLDKDWEDFKLYFEEVHVNFFNSLKEKYEDLTPYEMKLSALIKLNLSIKEMAIILGISPDSVKKARYRLRKKLGLNTEENLVEFMLAIEKESLLLA